MIPQQAAPFRDSVGEIPRRQADQIQTAGTAAFERGEPRTRRWRTLLFWLGFPLLIALTMQICGRISLLGATAMVVEDTRAKIHADYSPWSFLSFLPVDPAILSEISKDTGRISAVLEQDSSNQSFWGNPTSTPSATMAGEPTSSPTPSETPTAGDPSPTATLVGSASPTATVTTSPTATASPTATVTTSPTATPTTQGNQFFNFTSTPNAPNPTATGKNGSGDS
jgi:hypothetical protein